MEPTEFRRLVRLGLGRAVLYLQQHDTAPYRAIVVDACLSNDVYDQQVNGSRTRYLWDLVRALPDFEAIPAELIHELGPTQDVPYWVVKLLRQFAMDGHGEAGAFLRSLLLREPTSWSLITAVVELDAWAGVLLLSRVLEELPTDDDEARDAAKHAVRTAERHLGLDLSNPHSLIDLQDDEHDIIAAMIQRARSRRAREPHSTVMSAEERQRRVRLKDPSVIPFKDIWSTVEDQVRAGRVRSTAAHSNLGFTTYRDWGASADDLEVLHAAHELVVHAPADVARIARYAQIFFQRAFPLDPEPLFDIVSTNIESAGSDYWNDVTGWALHGVLTILSKYDDLRVRELAIELCQRSDWWRSYWIPLLLPSYSPRDQADIEAAIRMETDEEIIHGWGIDILDFCERTPGTELIPILLLLYERTPCAHCRGDIVKLLHQHDSLPVSMIEECRYDANESTRAFIATLDSGAA